MPCDTVRQMVAQAQMQNCSQDTLRKSLEKLGLEVWTIPGGFEFSGYIYSPGPGNRFNGTPVAGVFRNGSLNVRHVEPGAIITLFKRVYARQLVEDEARKNGWDIVKKKGKADEEKFTATKKYSNDKIEIEILKDGILKTSTDKISAVNHSTAEAFLLALSRGMGGETTVTSKSGSLHTHEHGHGHEHTH